MPDTILDYPEYHLLPDIHEYISYREYLVDYLKALWTHNPKRNSFRKINEILGTGNDHGYVQKLLGVNKEWQRSGSGKNLTDVFIMRFCKDLLLLDEEKTEYFITMVRYDQTTLNAEKQKLYQELCRLNNSVPILIPPEEYPLFQSWYILALRIILDVVDYPAGGETITSIARRINPAVSEKEVAGAIDCLHKAGMIAEDENGNLRPTEKRITTGNEARARIIREWQYDYFKIALQTFHKTGRLKPSFWTNTVSCSKKCVEEIDSLAKEFIKQVDMLVCSEKEKPETVYHINLQIFPLLKEDRSW